MAQSRDGRPPGTSTGENMDEIQFDDGRSVDKIGQRPTRDIDWEAIFQDATGGTDEPLSYATLSYIVSDIYNIELDTAEAYVYMASDHGELVRVGVDTIRGDLRFYYFYAPNHIEEIPTNLTIPDLSSEFLTDDRKVNLLSKDELVEYIDSASRRDLPPKFIRQVVEHIAHIEPFYVVNGRVGSKDAVVCMQS